jgi:hypothetical protein
MRDVLELTDGELRLWPVTLYGSLEELREEGWVEALAESGRHPEGESERKRYFRITRAGRRALDAEARRQGLELADIMAVASDDYGTLRRRMVGTPLEGAVVAKTGTLVHDDGGMASLGGVVYTQKYGKVYFVVFNQGSAVAESRQLTDQLLAEITVSQDTPVPIPKAEKPRHQLESTDLEVLE